MVLTTLEPKDNFKMLLGRYSGKWIWENLTVSEDTPWLAEGPRNRSILCVTDGSYMEHLYLDMSVTGWIIKCRATKEEAKASFVERLAMVGSYYERF